jgi:uncharacterized protein YbjT (DUF2867 family)
MTILVTGATGNVGRHVVAGLTSAGLAVRALTRDPARADLPASVEVVRGDLTDLTSVRSALEGDLQAVFLLWPFTEADDVGPLIDLLAKHAPHIVYLSARGVTDESLPYPRIERLLRESGAAWTFVRPGGFATNTLEWADQVRTGVVRWVYGEMGRSLIDERDIADVSVHVLTTPGHEGEVYELTGPETLTQVEQVRAIGAAVGRDVRWEEIPAGEARASLLARGWAPEFVDHGLGYWASLVEKPETSTKTVEELLGKPARTYAEWAHEHAGDFR